MGARGGAAPGAAARAPGARLRLLLAAAAGTALLAAGARAGAAGAAPPPPTPPAPPAFLAGAPPGALGRAGALLDVLGGGLFRPPLQARDSDPARFAAEARTVLAPVDAAFEEFFAFPRGHSFGELLASGSPRSSLSRLSLQPSRAVSLVRGHFLRELVPDPRAAAGQAFESFGGSKVTFFRDEAAGVFGVRDACGTTSRVVEGPLPWTDPVSGDERVLYLLDDLLVPAALCSYGF